MLEAEVVIASDHDFVSMRQRPEEGVELADSIEGPTSCHVAGVDKQITVWDMEVLMLFMGVTDGDETQSGHGTGSLWWTRLRFLSCEVNERLG